MPLIKCKFKLINKMPINCSLIWWNVNKWRWWFSCIKIAVLVKFSLIVARILAFIYLIKIYVCLQLAFKYGNLKIAMSLLTLVSSIRRILWFVICHILIWIYIYMYIDAPWAWLFNQLYSLISFYWKQQKQQQQQHWIYSLLLIVGGSVDSFFSYFSTFTKTARGDAKCTDYQPWNVYLFG